MTLALAHVFVFVDDAAAAQAALAHCGLAANAARAQDGQGTASLTACFDNACLELMWAEDPGALVSVSVARTRLSERSRWKETGASPFGIGLAGRMPFPHWEYRPPYRSEAAVPVALASEDPRQPFLFGAPADLRPEPGARQAAAGLSAVTGLHLDLPVGASPALRSLAERGVLSLKPAVKPRLLLNVSGNAGPMTLSLPDFRWV